MRGQMLLIVVLIMVVVLTVGLSAATRTITSLRVSNDEENSERAFSAAEAGLEQALSGSQTLVTGALDNTSTYRTTAVQLSAVEFLLNNSIPVLKDDAADIWLSQYPNYAQQYTGNLTIYWGSAGNVCNRAEAANTMAALDVVIVSGNSANPVMSHYPVDPCVARRTANRFGASGGGATFSGRTFPYSVTIAVNQGIIARVIPLYAPTLIGVRGCNAGGTGCLTLPAQGTTIESTGTADNAQRKIITFRTYPKLPTEVFPFVLFQPN
jgi:Tfp pilus assembly protein PilV